MKKIKLLSLFMVVVLISVFLHPTEAFAAAKISKKLVTMVVDDTVKLKVSGTTKAVSWSSSNTKLATVSKKGQVKAVAKGTATITAKVGKKSYQCTVVITKEKAAIIKLPTKYVEDKDLSKLKIGVEDEDGFILGRITDDYLFYILPETAQSDALKELDEEFKNFVETSDIVSLIDYDISYNYTTINFYVNPDTQNPAHEMSLAINARVYGYLYQLYSGIEEPVTVVNFIDGETGELLDSYN